MRPICHLLLPSAILLLTGSLDAGQAVLLASLILETTISYLPRHWQARRPANMAPVLTTPQAGDGCVECRGVRQAAV